jgi:hypothetical protein
MATTQCPSCSLVVPYFCCEGLVCPACGYDEEQDVRKGKEVTTVDIGSDTLLASSSHLPHTRRPAR